MDLSEAEKLTESPAVSDKKASAAAAVASGHPFRLAMEPFRWIRMLCTELPPSFIFGVILIYGLSQGFSGSYFRVVSDYYWKDVQKVQPSAVQVYIGIFTLPWVMKPIWGLMTDSFPVKGYLRRPYFVVAGILGTASALMVAADGGLTVAAAVSCLVALSAAMAIADVTIDACIVRYSMEVRALAPDLQSLCGACSSVGSLLGYSSSGFFVHLLGAQEALGLLAVPPALIVMLGFIIHEKRSTSLQHDKKKAFKELGTAIVEMYQTIIRPQVWKPALYMFLSFALSISTHEGQFYWYTDPKAGPAFSQGTVGIIYAIGAVASLVGVLIYHKTLKDCPFRSVLFFAQLLYGLTGMLDIVFILRWNLKLGIPDYFFVILEECVSRIVSRIRWTIMMVLNTRLCPVGIEGTFFALLACIDSLGMLCSKWGGGLVLHMFHVTRADFTNLWLVILIRNIMRLATLSLIFLVPNADQSEVFIPSTTAFRKKDSNVVEEDADGLLLVPMKVEDEV